MDWLDIHSFVTVARTQSISKASRLLHLTQPSLTARLKKIEAEYNVPLFERNWKGVTLTSRGQQFLFHALKLLEEYNALSVRLRVAEPETTHNLRIGVSRPLGSSFISPALQMFKHRYPELDYQVISEKSNYLLEMIAINQLHFGIFPYTRDLPNISSIPLFEEQLVLLAPKQDTRLKELEEDEWRGYLLSKTFFLHPHTETLRRTVEPVLHDMLGRLPERIIETNDTYPMLSFIANGLGYTLLPASYIYQAFQLAKPKPEDAPRTFTLAEHESVPFHIYLSRSLPRHMIYLVHRNDLLLEHLRLSRIVEDIRDTYGEAVFCAEQGETGKPPLTAQPVSFREM
ncbi:LysR family transcriptional regulator [Paenibacillus sp. IB182496]|uniref:LysR family transcriptional regulator n=1 Tax=Paenibacillus sabuli TaxID=2772509 RepID=A0A927GTF2_9BACL|nr:LysR family transcriptional regulator [Paenibacillus sabuli]MBD2847035.1 LysR family transcriptional regulator [Paenibacillus sabuli]